MKILIQILTNRKERRHDNIYLNSFKKNLIVPKKIDTLLNIQNALHSHAFCKCMDIDKKLFHDNQNMIIENCRLHICVP